MVDLKKFLPKLNKLNLQLLHKKQNLNQDQQPKQSESQSPNLILFSNVDITVQNLLPRIVVFTTYLALAASVAAIALLTWNNSLDRQLNALASERDAYIKEIAAMSEVEHNLNEIVSLTNKHKTIKDQRTLLFSQVDYIFQQLPGSMELEQITYENSVFKLTTVSETPLDIALFITGVLKNDNFVSVAINSVSLSNLDARYTSVLEVTVRQ